MSSLLWITPLVPVVLGLSLPLVRGRRLLAALDVSGSLVVLGLTLASLAGAGKRVMSPISAMKTAARIGPTPGRVCTAA